MGTLIRDVDAKKHSRIQRHGSGKWGIGSEAEWTSSEDMNNFCADHDPQCWHPMMRLKEEMTCREAPNRRTG